MDVIIKEGQYSAWFSSVVEMKDQKERNSRRKKCHQEFGGIGQVIGFLHCICHTSLVNLVYYGSILNSFR